MRASRTSATTAAGLLLLSASGVSAIDVDTSDSQSVIKACGTVASSIMASYQGNKGDGNVPGIFPEPYYWWESGWAWDTLIQYAHLTGDDQYNNAVAQAMLFQVGPDNNYMPPNQTKSLGNDDQSFWALAAMTAEETDFTLPEDAEVSSWQQLAQNVFDSQVARWDNDSCDGGLRWQIFSFNNGYNYKNSMTNGNFAELAARLYASTQNETYAEWFNKAVDWMAQVGLFDQDNGALYDGTDSTNDCKDVNHLQWSANTGILISAYSYMLATDRSAVNNTAPYQKLLSETASIFTKNNIITEPACLPIDTCNVDQLAFRGILARDLATAQALGVASSSAGNSSWSAILDASAKAAAAQCGDSNNGTVCGADWTKSTYDGKTGLSEDLSALNALLAALPQKMGAGGNGTSTAGSGSASGSNGTSTSSGGASGTSGEAGASGSAPAQQDENGVADRSASMFGLLAALGCAVAFFL